MILMLTILKHCKEFDQSGWRRSSHNLCEYF